jgi:sugar phosphate permease
LFMAFSSEMIHGLLPVFLVVNLGASAVVLGLIEGIAEATAQITRMLSGWLSDLLNRRKALTVAGYGLAAATKPLFPLATSVGTVLIARFADRVGKGIRGAPRDGLLADVAPPGQRGEAFGLRQSLDTVGAVLGPGAAIGLMILFRDDIRIVLWFAVIPAVISVAVLVLGSSLRKSTSLGVAIGLSSPRERCSCSRASARHSSSSARSKAALRSPGLLR